MAVTFEGYERRVEKINKCLAENGIASLEEALQICT
ncbi:MAG: GGGtGRT protein, partial [Paratractidigestivibacter faecalis]